MINLSIRNVSRFLVQHLFPSRLRSNKEKGKRKLSRALWDPPRCQAFSGLPFLACGVRFQPPRPSLSSNRQNQIVTSLRSEGRQKHMKVSQWGRVPVPPCQRQIGACQEHLPSASVPLQLLSFDHPWREFKVESEALLQGNWWNRSSDRYFQELISWSQFLLLFSR